MYVEERKSIYRKNPPHEAVMPRRQGAKPNRERCGNTVEEIRNTSIIINIYTKL